MKQAIEFKHPQETEDEGGVTRLLRLCQLVDLDLVADVLTLLHIKPTITFHVLYLELNKMDSNVNKVFA